MTPKKSPDRAEALAPGGSRAATGAASARASLLTILGEFVFPREGAAWTGTLVASMGALGVEEKAARQAIARTAAAGVLEPERHGRRVRWSLTDQGRRLLDTGTTRIYSFLREPRRWDGQWLIVTVAVPESQRNTRHRLRTRLTWLGLGSPTPGLWVVPDADKEGEVREVLRELDLVERAFVWVGRRTAGTDPSALLEAAWDLGDVADRYRTFIADICDVDVSTDERAFCEQVRLVQAWRQFPFLDPDLPAELLSEDWPGVEAAAVFHDRRDRWHRRAQREWERLEAEAEARA